MPAVDSDIEKVEAIFAVNVVGPMRMVSHFHDMICNAKGTIINIGSIAGVTPYVYQAAYNASKAALHHYGNTLRVEMKPFGVRVINVISGEVCTNILTKDSNNQLPEGSIFEPLTKEYLAHVRRTPATITPQAYAVKVVAEAMKVSPQAWLWHGSQTGIVWFVDTFLPRTFWDLLFWRMFEFKKLIMQVKN